MKCYDAMCWVEMAGIIIRLGQEKKKPFSLILLIFHFPGAFPSVQELCISAKGCTSRGWGVAGGFMGGSPLENGFFSGIERPGRSLSFLALKAAFLGHFGGFFFHQPPRFHLWVTGAKLTSGAILQTWPIFVLFGYLPQPWGS